MQLLRTKKIFHHEYGIILLYIIFETVLQMHFDAMNMPQLILDFALQRLKNEEN